MATRFAEVSEEDVTVIVSEGVPQKTKEATSYVVKVFEGKKKTVNKTYLFQSYKHLTNKRTLTKKT